jgi:hypothetical protein
VREIESAAVLPEPEPVPERVTIADAIARFLSECKARNLSEATISKYRVLLEKQLTPFIEKKAIHHLDEFTIELLREFRLHWKDAPLAASKKSERLRAFFRFSHDSGYIKLNPAIHLQLPKVKPSEKQPFDETEIEKILWACDVYDTRGTYGEGNRHRLRAFVLVLRRDAQAISGERRQDLRPHAEGRNAGSRSRSSCGYRSLEPGTSRKLRLLFLEWLRSSEIQRSELAAQLTKTLRTRRHRERPCTSDARNNGS